jgi:excinuclease ABC subunit A
LDHKKIVIKGARENNLKNIDLELPKDQLIVFTVCREAGKPPWRSIPSTWKDNAGTSNRCRATPAVFRQLRETRRRIDRGFVAGHFHRSKTTSHNPRSTVGTVTEIYDYLRLLFARIGVPYCPIHHEPIIAFSPSQMVSIILEAEPNSRIQVLAPVVSDEKGTIKTPSPKSRLKALNACASTG